MTKLYNTGGAAGFSYVCRKGSPHTRLLLMALALCTTACMKEEIPVPPFERGEVETVQVSKGPFYRDQVWYSLERNEVTGLNALTDWDVAFAGNPALPAIYLNDGRYMMAWISPHTNIHGPLDSLGYGRNRRVEVTAHFHSSPALGDWELQPNHCILMDMGVDHLGAQLGLWWMQVTEVSSAGYTVLSRPFNRSEVQEHFIPADPERMLVRYHLREAELRPSAPPDGEWDLLFSRYTFRFLDPPIDYMVTGVIINPAGVLAKELITELPFPEISLDDLQPDALHNAPDAIGYDWKTFRFDISRFEVDPSRTYVVRGMGGLHFKLRFVDFYDTQGAAGAPTFERAII